MNMEKENKSINQPPTDSKEQRPLPMMLDSIRIGEVVLGSQVLRADTLCALAVELLKVPVVKDYLQLLDAKKRSGTYSGVVG